MINTESEFRVFLSMIAESNPGLKITEHDATLALGFENSLAIGDYIVWHKNQKKVWAKLDQKTGRNPLFDAARPMIRQFAVDLQMKDIRLMYGPSGDILNVWGTWYPLMDRG